MWEFLIDVGGTFTDCIAYSSEQELQTCKVLSSGITQGIVSQAQSTLSFIDKNRIGDAPHFWRSYDIQFIDEQGACISQSQIEEFDNAIGCFLLQAENPCSFAVGLRYELYANEAAPVLAIRKILKLPLSESIPVIDLKLGTTRGTNALLTRTGARTALITTLGFADVLLIANQDREHLFQLNIKKQAPLFEQVVEIAERIDADGNILKPPDLQSARKQLVRLKESGIEAVAICLLHAFANSAHEEQIEQIANEIGFRDVSVSSKLSPLIKIVPRGETTVVNAYLNPVLGDYIKNLQQSLGGSRMRMMTSTGGLVEADRFCGKESILSGPAGGVIGYSKVAEVAGFKKSIGFDMGGTSTDVSRFDGTYDYEYETKKAGVRIVSPMLAVETVAAGGGSLCQFDGVKLAVGPESATAIPGPACYGRNGPLTVTDMNLFLGRIQPQHFPFPLDVEIVNCKLDELCETIANSPLGQQYTPSELAEGFLEIANANMVRAIKRISVAKGYHPVDYVLVTFGGAGAQHACGGGTRIEY